jgi:hypothetical protein
MIEVPSWVAGPELWRIKDARSVTAADPKAAFAVEQLVAMFVQAREQIHRQADEHRAERDRLEKLVVRLGGGFDRRGLDGDPPGFIVQHGIHTVVEDSR